MSSSQTSSSSFDGPAAAVDESNQASIAAMHDVRCQVDFILGTGTITIRECLRLQQQSIIRLAQSAGSDLSVRVHEIGIATGEVVIADETTALRISRVSPPVGVEPE